MLCNKTIAVVVPAYNEESQILAVLRTMPDFVDRIVVVDDASQDRTVAIVEAYSREHGEGPHPCCIVPLEPDTSSEIGRLFYRLDQEEDARFLPSQVVNDAPDRQRVILIRNLVNGGVGAAIARGYKWCRDCDIDCTAVMAGDAQMDPSELEGLCLPVVEAAVDYVKGNRLIHRTARAVIPKVRFFGNSVLSLLTKIASGYWRVSDTQTGYTAISLRALKAIRLDEIYKRYGMPNDMLVKLNMAYCTMREVEIRPVYNVGEQSKMRVGRVVFTISWLLTRLFFKRIWGKYFFRDFHPLFILYNMGLILFLANIPIAISIIETTLSGAQYRTSVLILFAILCISSFQSLVFAMWMDIQDNERLYK